MLVKNDKNRGDEVQFNLLTAQEYAAAGRLEDWIHAYLTTGEWANHGLSNGLKLQQRYWLGPLALPLAKLNRVCGPEAEMEYIEPVDGWEQRIGILMQNIQALEDVPPLIIHHRANDLSIRDGNHRHEALRRLGYESCYVLLWYDDSVSWANSCYRD